MIAPAGARISLVAYPLAGPPAPASPPTAVCALLEQLANRTHVVMVSGMADPEVRIGIMREADARVLLYEPTLASISAAVHCLASLGRDWVHRARAVPSEDAQERPLPRPDPLCARRAAPRRRGSVRCRAPRRHHRQRPRPVTRQGVPQGPGRGGRARKSKARLPPRVPDRRRSAGTLDLGCVCCARTEPGAADVEVVDH